MLASHHRNFDPFSISNFNKSTTL